MTTPNSGPQAQGPARLTAVPSATEPKDDFDLEKLGFVSEGAGRAREVPPSPRMKDMKVKRGWVYAAIGDLDVRLSALDKAESKSKLGDSARKYGLEVLREEFRLLKELGLHYDRQLEEAAIEHAELNRIELIVAGDTVPNIKPNGR